MEESEIKLTALIMAILLWSSCALSAGQVSPSPASMPDEGGFYTAQVPAAACQLTDMGGYGIPYQSGSCHNQLWILDLCGKNRLQDMSIPFATWARMQFVPSDRGYVMLFHRLPSGDLQTLYLGMVYPGHCYSSWFYASAMGSHELWYRIGWQESNRVRFHVWC